jgi:hypothetical protein
MRVFVFIKTEEFEPALIGGYAKREQGTLIEIMLDPEAITTRGTTQLQLHKTHSKIKNKI